MIDVKVEESTDTALAELISSTLHGHIPTNPGSSSAQVGQLVREQQEQEERQRPSRQELETVNFATLDPENDWSDV